MIKELKRRKFLNAKARFARLHLRGGRGYHDGCCTRNNEHGNHRAGLRKVRGDYVVEKLLKASCLLYEKKQRGTGHITSSLTRFRVSLRITRRMHVIAFASSTGFCFPLSPSFSATSSTPFRCARGSNLDRYSDELLERESTKNHLAIFFNSP